MNSKITSAFQRKFHKGYYLRVSDPYQISFSSQKQNL